MTSSKPTYLVVVFGALMLMAVAAVGRTSGRPRDKWEYAVLHLQETSYWGSLERDRSLLWLTPSGGREGIHRATDPDKDLGMLTYPKEYFDAVGGVAVDNQGTEATLLSQIGLQGWQLVERRDSQHDTSIVGTGDKPDRKATIRESEWTFMRSVE